MLIKLQISCVLAADRALCATKQLRYFKSSVITYNGGAAKKDAFMNI